MHQLRKLQTLMPIYLIGLLSYSPFAMADGISLMSLTTEGEIFNQASSIPSVSADGRYLAFRSRGSNGFAQIYVRDRLLETTTLISQNTRGEPSENNSTDAKISSSGRYVVFASKASNLVDNDVNGQYDVFLHDRQLGHTSIISTNSLGELGNDLSRRPAISFDEQFVVFESKASNLVANDNNGERDIFVHDLVKHETTRVSLGIFASEANAPSYHSSISGDGRYVAFLSYATNLVLGDINGYVDVFVRDRVSGTTTRESVRGYAVEANYSSGAPNISADGRYIVFTSSASNLVDNDANGEADVFLRDRLYQITNMVSTDLNGVQAAGGSFFSTFSSDGKYVAFNSKGENFAGGAGSTYLQIYLKDLLSGKLRLISKDQYGNPGNQTSLRPTISADGRYVGFESVATNFSPTGTHQQTNCFIFSRQRFNFTKLFSSTGNPIPIGSWVYLDTILSDPDNDQLESIWSLVSKTARSSYSFIDYPDRGNAWFKANTKGEFTLKLRITSYPPYPDMPTLNGQKSIYLIAGNNQPPIVNAGPDQTIYNDGTGLSLSKLSALGVMANLAGSASDPDNDPLTIRWTVVSKPSGANVTIYPTSRLNPSVVMDIDGRYVFRLTATENLVNGPEYSASDSVVIKVISR